MSNHGYRIQSSHVGIKDIPTDWLFLVSLLTSQIFVLFCPPFTSFVVCVSIAVFIADANIGNLSCLIVVCCSLSNCRPPPSLIAHQINSLELGITTPSSAAHPNLFVAVFLVDSSIQLRLHHLPDEQLH